MPLAHNKQTGETLFLNEAGEWSPAKTAKNPQTGERLAFDGSEWHPIASEPQEAPESKTEAPWYEEAYDTFKGVSDAAANTATFGLADYARGAGAKAASALFGDETPTLEEARLASKREREAFAESHPVASGASGVVGALANPAAQVAGRWMGAAPTIKGAALRGAAGGAGLAGAQAAGESEGALADRAGQVAVASALGAAFGGAVPPAIAGAFGGGRWLANQTWNRLPFAQQTAAARKVAEAMRRDGLTIEQAAQRIDELGPEGMIADLGPGTRGLTFRAASVPGRGKEIIERRLTQRQEGARDPSGVLQGGQIERIGRNIDELVPGSFRGTRAGIEAENQAGQLYNQAYRANQQIDSPVIDKILNTPTGKQAFRDAVRNMQDDMTLVGKADPELTAALDEAIQSGQQIEKAGHGVARGLKLRTLDYVKRALQDTEGYVAAKSPDRARIIGKMRRRLTDELDRLDATGGAYSAARGVHGTKMSNLEALDLGAGFMTGAKRSHPGALRETLEGMSQEERHLFRLGAAQAIKDKIGGLVTRADATKKISDIPALEEKIRLAFGDRELFRRYAQMVESEKAMFKTYADALKGSQTAERAAILDESAVDPGKIMGGLGQMASMNPLNWLAGGAKAVSGLGDLMGLTTSGPMSRRLAEALMSRDPRALQEAYRIAQQSDAGKNFLTNLLLRGGAMEVAPEVAAPSHGGRLANELRGR